MRKSTSAILAALLVVGVVLLWRLWTPTGARGASGGSSAPGKPKTAHVVNAIPVLQNTAKSAPMKPVHAQAAAPSGSDSARANSEHGAVKEPDWAQVSDRVKLLAGQTGEKGYAARVEAVHRLGQTLASNDVRALCWFLGVPAAVQRDMDAMSFNALKNDVLDALIGQDRMPPDLQQVLVGNVRDKAMDVTWRDYCVQHYSIYYETRWTPDDGGRLAGTDRADLMAAYDEALAEPEDGIAGTALVGLERLSNRYPEIDRAALGLKALQLLQDGRSDIQTRIAAMNVCGMTRMKDALPTARIQAQTAEAIPLRLASIATIGQAGDAQDKELLEGLLAGADKTVHKAAAVALKAIDARGTAAGQAAH